jgi:hypothetical protein
MALNNTQTNFGYDHASYLARGTWNATIAAGSGSTLKFVAHANLQLMAVTATLATAGTSTYTKTQYYNNGSNTLTVHVANNQYTVTRITNTAASGAAASFSTTTQAQFSPDIYSTVNAGTSTGVAGSWYTQALNSSTGTAGLYGVTVLQGDTITITAGTDATAVAHFVVDWQVQPLANLTA